jgi:hypothetical protein
MSCSKRLSAKEIEVILDSDSEAFSEEENASHRHEDDDYEEEEQEGQEQQQQQPQSASEWRLPSAGARSLTTLHNFTGGPHGMKISEAPHINKTSNPLAVFRKVHPLPDMSV